MQTATAQTETRKRPEGGAKWREMGGNAVRSNSPLKSTQPTHTDAKTRKDPVKDAYTTCGNTDWGGEVLDSHRVTDHTNELLSQKPNLKPCSRSRRVSSSFAVSNSRARAPFSDMCDSRFLPAWPIPKPRCLSPWVTCVATRTDTRLVRFETAR
jgi:hypothetical protein